MKQAGKAEQGRRKMCKEGETPRQGIIGVGRAGEKKNIRRNFTEGPFIKTGKEDGFPCLEVGRDGYQ